MQLTPGLNYYQELIEYLPRARTRIVLATMVLHSDDKMDRLFDLLTGALGRGVTVHVLFDAYSRLPFAYNELTLSLSHRRRVQRLMVKMNQLRAAGATVSMIGKIGLNPFKGRSHAKLAVIDDVVWAFGGINLDEGSFENVDYMIKTQDASLADTLAELTRELGAGELRLDLDYRLSEHNTLLWDAGRPGDSMIYDRACELADQARNIIYVSQMCPSGRLARLMGRTSYAAYYNRVNQMSVPANFAQAADQYLSGIRNLYQRPEFIHAKFILFELHDGTKALISGSHNFSYRGVDYGTGEIALASTDVSLWDALDDFRRQQVA